MSDIGSKIHYKSNRGKGRDVVGTIVSIKDGNPLTNVKTGETNHNTYKLKIKPDDGSRCFWTDSLRKV